MGALWVDDSRLPSNAEYFRFGGEGHVIASSIRTVIQNLLYVMPMTGRKRYYWMASQYAQEGVIPLVRVPANRSKNIS